MENVVQRIKNVKDGLQTSVKNAWQKIKNGFPTLMTDAVQQVKSLQIQLPKVQSLKEWEKLVLIVVPYIIGCIALGICIGIQGERTIGLKDGLILPLEFGTETIRLATKGICNSLLFILEGIDCINDGFSRKSCSPLLSFKPSLITLEVVFAWIYLSLIGLLAGSTLQQRYQKMSRKKGGVKRSATASAGRARKLFIKACQEYRKPILVSVATAVFFITCSICICSQKECSTVDYALAPLTTVLGLVSQLIRGVLVGLFWILGCPDAPANPKPLDLPKIEMPSVKVPQIQAPDLSKIEIPVPHLPSRSKSWSGWISGVASRGSNWVPSFGSGSSWSVHWPSSKSMTSWIPKASSVGSKTVAVPTFKLKEVQPPKIYVPTLTTKQVTVKTLSYRLVPFILLVIPLLCLLAYFLVQWILMVSAKFQRKKTALDINQEGKWEYGASSKRMKLEQN